MLFERFGTPDDCYLLPSICISAGRCDNQDFSICDEIHAWQLTANWLWWGIAVTTGVDAK